MNFYKRCMAIAILSIVSFTARAQVVLFTEGFETDGEGSRYTSNTFSFCSGVPGNNPDYFLRTNTNPVLPPGCTIGFTDVLTNLQGSFFWASEDIRSSAPVPNANPPGQITTQSISISGYGSLAVSLFLATSSNNNIRWESADSINIQASINGGAFFTVGRFMGDNPIGGRLRIDGNLDGAITGADPATTCDQLNFTQYSFSIPGSGTTLRVRLDYDQLGGTEEIGIDQLQVTGFSVLPVKLLHFNASLLVNNEVAINWKVDENSDADWFDIEKSTNGIDFIVLSRIMAGSARTYTLTDYSPVSGAVYYRLKMTDSHGKITYSMVVSVSKKIVGFEIRSVTPNPARTNAMVRFVSPVSIAGFVSIWSANGKRVVLLPVTIVSGETVMPVDVSGLPAGLYILQCTDRAGTLLATSRLLKQ